MHQKQAQQQVSASGTLGADTFHHCSGLKLQFQSTTTMCRDQRASFSTCLVDVFKPPVFCLVFRKNNSCDVSEKLNWHNYSCAFKPLFPRITFINIQSSCKTPSPSRCVTYLDVNACNFSLIWMPKHYFFVLTTTNLHTMAADVWESRSTLL